MASSIASRTSNSSLLPRHLLLTGVPGVGKTTLMSKLYDVLTKQGIQCSGFITEEVRSGGRRIGFDVVTMDGHKGQLARICDSTDAPGSSKRHCKVGQYSVNILSFEQTALPTLQPQGKDKGRSSTIYFVDEIGRMELFSQNFIQAVRKVLSKPDITVVATIPVPKGRPIPFVEELRNGDYSVIFEFHLRPTHVLQGSGCVPPT
ncbi:cancer-related nucleoside-triphosphatase homolog isoform X2 [Aplysia californica]|uniref:Cancer-related nucleoside-triphosphatase homolog isoform X2 n=1 Tax=Aplysia californica TaxID=6500 RepID=A0ABM1W2E4_APLCA|nr:cancer-related nucleoside-triphosphatase homolog isoform X2 [Aplysia californica]